MVYIPRNLEKILKTTAPKFKAVFITGPRQAGKTTLAQKIFKNYIYFNLEAPDILVQAKENPRSLLQHKKIILDEVQNASWLLSYLLELLDSNKIQHVILTGSQSILISEQVTQSLSGRVLITELYPFTINEINKKTHRELNNILFTGFYPQPFLQEEDFFTTAWYKSYLTTYVERDIRALQNIKNLADFYTFLNLLAAQTGQLLNLNLISNQIGISVNTLKTWLSLLEATYTVFLLRPYHTNIKKRFTKMPKVYFWDTGLLTFLLKINSTKTLTLTPFLGQIFENLIISDLAKTIQHHMLNVNLYFLRDHTGHEIDLLIETTPNNLIGIEVKASQTVLPKHSKHLNYYTKLLPITQKFVVYATSDTEYLEKMDTLNPEINYVSWENTWEKIREILS